MISIAFCTIIRENAQKADFLQYFDVLLNKIVNLLDNIKNDQIYEEQKLKDKIDDLCPVEIFKETINNLKRQGSYNLEAWVGGCTHEMQIMISSILNTSILLSENSKEKEIIRKIVRVKEKKHIY